MGKKIPLNEILIRREVIALRRGDRRDYDQMALKSRPTMCYQTPEESLVGVLKKFPFQRLQEEG